MRTPLSLMSNVIFLWQTLVDAIIDKRQNIATYGLNIDIHWLRLLIFSLKCVPNTLFCDIVYHLWEELSPLWTYTVNTTIVYRLQYGNTFQILQTMCLINGGDSKGHCSSDWYFSSLSHVCHGLALHLECHLSEGVCVSNCSIA